MDDEFEIHVLPAESDGQTTKQERKESQTVAYARTPMAF